jgi:hypothetical protein
MKERSYGVPALPSTLLSDNLRRPQMSCLAVGQMLFRLYEKDSSPLSVNRWSQAVLVCSFCTVFAACAAGQSVQQRAAKPPIAVSAQPAESAPLAYYAGVDRLAVYSEPRSSASLLTQLPLHQKVYRSKMEKGYAYIKVEGSGITGWVDNARLIWRLPSPQQKAPMKTEERATEPAPAVEEKAPTAAEVAEPEPTPTAAEAPTEQTPSSPAAAPTSVSPAQSAPATPSAPRPIEPSIFNPF